MLNKVKRYFHNPYYAFGYDLINMFPHLMSDKYYLSILWKMVMGYEIDWKRPKSFNEKLQWLKLYNRNPLYCTLVDKYRVKQWINNKIGERFTIPTFAVYNSVNEIDLDRLPNSFVLKCNHDSGSVFICEDKASFNLEAAKISLKKAAKKNFYWEAREWPYKNVERCIFAEKFLGPNLQDYRIYCFNGEPLLIYSYTNVSNEEGSKPEPCFCDVFDTDWRPLDIRQKSKPRGNIPPPYHLEEMLSCSRSLSENIPFVRVDFFDNDTECVVVELTLFPGGGLSEFHPKEWDTILGEKLHIVPYTK